MGSEQKGDHVWVIVSVASCHRANCVVGVPLSKHMNKAGGHLIKLPHQFISYSANEPTLDRVALVDQIRVIDKTRLRRKIGTLSKLGISGVFQGLDRLFGRAVVTRPVASQSPAAAAKTEPRAKLASATPAPAAPKSPALIPGTPTGNA